MFFFDSLELPFKLWQVRLSPSSCSLHVDKAGSEGLVLAPLPLQFLRLSFHLLCNNNNNNKQNTSTRVEEVEIRGKETRVNKKNCGTP